ncbi:MAG: 3-deoxy-7-phosphoheptulonate synthase [bacterium]
MIIVMKQGATQAEIDHVVEKIEGLGFKAHPSTGTERTIIGLIGDERHLSESSFEVLPGVERVMRVLKPYKLASREFHPENTIIEIDGVAIGGEEVVVMAGPCAVESEKQIVEIARAVKRAGAKILRGGAFKPRTGPYDFQGLGEDGLKYLREAREETGLLVVTEVMSPDEVPLVERYADILQIGARNATNYNLLKRVGDSPKPVLLKRGWSSTLREFLLAAEYILSQGNKNVMLCERGIRTFETHTRFTLDLNAVPALKELSHLPVIVDPSHGTGQRGLVPPMSRASIAAGADGLIIEVHNDPENSLTNDGEQSLLPEQFAELMEGLKLLAAAVGRKM